MVLLRTGTGKTWVAADAIVQLGKLAVFFVPTIMLVDQPATALCSHPGMPLVGEYHSDMSIPNTFEVLVTTPKVFETAQSHGVKTFDRKSFGIVVFDKVHHVIKYHPYRSLAFKLE
jgi:superfamily II DNA or RNA helicase